MPSSESELTSLLKAVENEQIPYDPPYGGLYDYLAVWMGIDDLEVEGQWMWNNGRPLTWNMWDTHQPDNWGDMEDCAYLVLRGDEYRAENTFHDAPCSLKYSFFCQGK